VESTDHVPLPLTVDGFETVDRQFECQALVLVLRKSDLEVTFVSLQLYQPFIDIVVGLNCGFTHRYLLGKSFAPLIRQGVEVNAV
jgi:hypothetical protein